MPVPSASSPPLAQAPGGECVRCRQGQRRLASSQGHLLEPAHAHLPTPHSHPHQGPAGRNLDPPRLPQPPSTQGASALNHRVLAPKASLDLPLSGGHSLEHPWPPPHSHTCSVQLHGGGAGGVPKNRTLELSGSNPSFITSYLGYVDHLQSPSCLSFLTCSIEVTTARTSVGCHVA